VFTPSVSIVLPVYNAVDTVASAVESIRRQSLADWELVMVDDGSTDGSRAELARYAALDLRIRLLGRTHRGLVASLNDGVASARASLIARMDADDQAHPERLERQVRYLEEHREFGLGGCLVEFGGNRQQAAGFALHVDWINSLVSPRSIELNRFVESPFAHPSVVFRREVFDRLGGYREGDFPEDYELWLRWLDAGVRMGKVPLSLLTWNDSATRLSRVGSRYSPDAFYRCKAIYLARWLRREVNPARLLIIWGAGRPTRKRAEYLAKEGMAIGAYVDIDPKKVGRRLACRPVLAPNELPDRAQCFVLCYVAKRGARELARAHLRSRGFVEGEDFLLAA
jgi:glycosyltransferase involved in cell wall biosynthesis